MKASAGRIFSGGSKGEPISLFFPVPRKAYSFIRLHFSDPCSFLHLQSQKFGVFKLLPELLRSPARPPPPPTLVFCHGRIWAITLSEVAQSCPTLCDPMDRSLSGSSIHGIFQARVLEWIAISFFRGSSRPRNRTRVSHIADRRFTI